MAPENVLIKLKEMMALHSGNAFYEALARDYVEMMGTNLGASGKGISLSKLGLKEIVSSGGLNTDVVIPKYPEWTKSLKNSESEFSKLIKEEEWETLGAIFDVIYDNDTKIILSKILGQKPLSLKGKSFVEMLILKGDPQTLQSLARYTFSQPHTVEMKDLLKMLIEKGDPYTLQNLAAYTFSQPHTVEMKDLLKMLIDKGDPKTLIYLATSTFSQPHTTEMKDLLKLLIEKGGSHTLQSLARNTFSKSHTTEIKDLLKLLIEKGDSHTLQSLAKYTFSESHTQGEEYKILRESIKILDPLERKKFLEQMDLPLKWGKLGIGTKGSCGKEGSAFEIIGKAVEELNGGQLSF